MTHPRKLSALQLSSLVFWAGALLLALGSAVPATAQVEQAWVYIDGMG